MKPYMFTVALVSAVRPQWLKAYSMPRLDTNELSEGFLGAPLDFLKTVAAVSMFLESANFALFENQFRIPWYIDRWTFPLFSFAMAVHLVRGFDYGRQVVSLLLLGAVTQPVYAVVFPEFDHVNILITLAIGAALAGMLVNRPWYVTDAVLGSALIATLVFPELFGGWEYGLLGAVLPLAIASALKGPRTRILWPCLLIGTTYLRYRFGEPDWIGVVTIELGFALVGTTCVIAASYFLNGMPRFLPRYALHVFYPSHLALILVLQRLWLAW